MGSLRGRFLDAASSDATVHRCRQSIVTGTIIVIVGISYVGALCIRSLGFVNVIDGALCVGAFTALVPSLVGLRMLDRKGSMAWKAAMICLLVFGLTNAFLGIRYNDNYRSDLAQHCAYEGPWAKASPHHGTLVEGPGSGIDGPPQART